MSMTADELRHYSRHLLLEEVGPEGQDKLKNASVLLIGAGGLGCPAALYLAAAGVGTLGIIDPDTVDPTNLQRQIAFTYEDVGKPKGESIKKRLKAINPFINIKIYAERFNIDNAAALVSDYDVIVDGCDNFGTRYLSNDATFFGGKPLIFGAIHRFQGQMSVFNSYAEAPCYRCMFPNPPDAGSIPNCAEAGVLGVLPGIVGSIQATEAIKQILGIGDSLEGRFMIYDALKMTFSEFKLSKNSSCPLCSDKAVITELQETELLCSSQQNSKVDISPRELNEKIDNGDDFILIDVRESFEVVLCKIDGAVHIPLRNIEEASKRLEKDKEIVLYCHHGMRSMSALKILKGSGFRLLRNLSGGISAWAEKIDTEMPQY